MRRFALPLLAVALAAGLAGGWALRHGRAQGSADGVDGVLQRYGPAARADLEPACRQARIAWPPARVYLLAFKAERSLEVWGANARGPYCRIATYPILAASGGPGPKLREGDHQVPEGLYRLTTLNPASHFHLSMRVDYPNADDRAHAVVPRGRLGGDIYVHGNRVSDGCIAIGDEAIEKVFCLVAQARPSQRRILIAPVDFRRSPGFVLSGAPAWVRQMHDRLRARLAGFPA